MKDLTDEQIFTVIVTQKIFKSPMIAKVLKKCYERGIDFDRDNLANCVAPIVGTLSPQELNEYMLEIARFPNSKSEFNAIVDKYMKDFNKTTVGGEFELVDGTIVGWRAEPLDDDFDLDSKIIN